MADRESRLPFRGLVPDWVWHTRFLGITLGAWFDAVPDLALGLIALFCWLVPSPVAERGYLYILIILVTEFLIIYFSPLALFAMLGLRTPWLVWPVLLGIAIYYTWFGRHIWAEHIYAPFISFWLLTLNRMQFVLRPITERDDERIRNEAGYSVLFFFASVILIFNLPHIPPLGLAGLDIAERTTADTITAQQTLAIGTLYFMLQGARELLRDCFSTRKTNDTATDR